MWKLNTISFPDCGAAPVIAWVEFRPGQEDHYSPFVQVTDRVLLNSVQLRPPATAVFQLQAYPNHHVRPQS